MEDLPELRKEQIAAAQFRDRRLPPTLPLKFPPAVIGEPDAWTVLVYGWYRGCESSA